jgi:hypothetical protein
MSVISETQPLPLKDGLIHKDVYINESTEKKTMSLEFTFLVHNG